MIVTRRRLNLYQAWRISGREWVAVSDLPALGAYGSEQSIKRALYKLYAAGIIARRHTAPGVQEISFTHQGVIGFGGFPEKREKPHDQPTHHR